MSYAAVSSSVVWLSSTTASATTGIVFPGFPSFLAFLGGFPYPFLHSIPNIRCLYLL